MSTRCKLWHLHVLIFKYNSFSSAFRTRDYKAYLNIFDVTEWLRLEGTSGSFWPTSVQARTLRAWSPGPHPGSFRSSPLMRSPTGSLGIQCQCSAQQCFLMVIHNFVFLLVPSASCPGKEKGLALSSFQPSSRYLYTSARSLEPSPLQAKKSQISQLFLMMSLRYTWA